MSLWVLLLPTGRWTEKMLCGKKHTPHATRHMPHSTRHTPWMTSQPSGEFWILWSSNSSSEKHMDFHTPCWWLRWVSKVCSSIPWRRARDRAGESKWKVPKSLYTQDKTSGDSRSNSALQIHQRPVKGWPSLEVSVGERSCSNDHSKIYAVF